MENFRIGFFLLLAIADTLSLHIVISPDEASKLMKRNDEFSKGLAGFIDNALADSKHVKVTKREKVNELKSMIQKVLDEIDSKKDDGSKKDANKAKKNAPPALPLDTTSSKDVRGLETLVNDLLDEVSQKEKRQGWVHYGKKKEVEEKKKQLEEEEKEMDNTQAKLEQIYEKVKRLVSISKGSKANDANAEEKREEAIITDSGDVGSRLLKHVRNMIAKKSEEGDKKKDANNALIEKLNDLTKRLAERKIGSSDIGEMSLNAIKRMIAGKSKKEKSHDEVKSHPKSKAKDQVSIDSLMDEVNDLLRKMKPKSAKKGESSSDEEVKSEVAVESKERPHNAQKRRELLAKLIRTYDALTKGNADKKDSVEEELETLSSKVAKRGSGKVSRETAKAIQGFDVEEQGRKRISHPK